MFRLKNRDQLQQKSSRITGDKTRLAAQFYDTVQIFSESIPWPDTLPPLYDAFLEGVFTLVVIGQLKIFFVQISIHSTNLQTCASKEIGYTVFIIGN